MEEKNITKKSDVVLREERVLNFWKEQRIFTKSVEANEGKPEFVFYEGPPTANGKPGIHHLEARAFKDAIPRYKTMRGFHVRRKGGWDTHGLPVELQVEKKLGLNSKKAIEEFGIDKFNQECKKSVWEYLEIWNKFTERIGYWVDQDNPYVTYHNNYIESVWSILEKVNNQKLLYKDYKVVPWCPRCETALSSHELAQGYEDVKDLSITAKFKLTNSASEKFFQVLGKNPQTVQKSSPGSVFILAWTTTPWTLPGNIALAVGEDIDYVLVKVENDFVILAKERLAKVAEGHEVLGELKGKDLVGLEYEPLFPYLRNLLQQEGESIEKAFKVYSADFVTTEDGTGVVHTAVMYGQDDFELGTKLGLPKIHLVSPDGKFVKGTSFLEGRFVREEIDGKPTLAVDLIKELQAKNLFFSKENYLHSYPHCWRCHTALIYYARDSWYIRMSDPDVKGRLISENKKINWEPEHTREGRFGEWLKDIKDWAVSRERYWGTPLPVWECFRCDNRSVIGGLEDLKNKSKKSGNKYFVMRHGEAEKNVKNIINSTNDNPSPLTAKGRERAKDGAKNIGEKIDLIFASPLLRTQETAKIAAEELGLSPKEIITDDRLIEIQSGVLNDKPITEFRSFFASHSDRFHQAPDGGENLTQVKRRMGEFLYDIDKKYADKNILIVSHEDSIWMLEAAAKGLDSYGSSLLWLPGGKNFIDMGEAREIEFTPIPHNQDCELDFHRPFIDEIKLVCDCGGEMTRVKEVMDVWFDSGAMPFAQDHYPFENKKWVDGDGFPADYISEAIDQTRGWFYTLHAIGVLMGKGQAYKNVICLGHLLDANGKKMSKSLGNVVDPWDMIEKYGVDTLRLWMYSVNQPGESKNFDEKTVALLNQQVFGLLYNVLAFYELYRDKSLENKTENIEPDNILDQWILVRLVELSNLCTENMDEYRLLEPVRAIRDFVNDLSTWYLRRSRDTIKGGDESTKQTLYFVLKTLAKIMAPFAPLASEDIWIKLRNESDVESVHLASWPDVADMGRYDVVEFMQRTREIVSLGLEARQQAKIQVRQPLAKITVKNLKLKEEFIALIKEELNVKEVVEDNSIEKEVELDTVITPELKAEGDYREFVRALQEARKKQGLNPSQPVKITINATKEGKELLKKFSKDLQKVVLAVKIEVKKTEGEEIKIGKIVFKVKIEKK